MTSHAIISTIQQKTIVVIVWLFFTCFFDINGQDHLCDSLEIQLIFAEDSQKLRIYDDLIRIHLRNHPLLSKDQAEKQLLLARELNSKKYEIHALLNLGLSYNHLVSDNVKPLDYCNEALEKAMVEGEAGEIIRSYMVKATIYKENGNNYEALENLLEALQLAEKNKLTGLIVDILQQEALVYLDLTDYNMADDCLTRALILAKNLKCEQVIADIHEIYGRFYYLRNNFKSSLAYYKLVYEYYKTTDDNFAIARCFHNIGEGYHALNKFNLSIQYHNKALEIRKLTSDITGIAESHILIGNLYSDKKQFQKAIDHLITGLKNAQMVNSKELIKECYNNLYYAYVALNDFNKAYFYKDKYAAISRLIYMEAGERKIEALTSKYEIGQREQEIRFLKDKFSTQQRAIDRSRMYNMTMIFLIFLLIIFGAITFYLYREKRKFNTRLKKINNKVVRQNHELREINNTKDKFFSIIAHDLKGPLNSMTSFSELLINHTSSMSPKEIKIVAKDLNQSLKTIYCLMENLFAWARSQTGKIDINPEPFNISEALTHSIHLLSNSAQNKGIKINVAKDEHAEVYADKNSVMTILRNLISNAIKFTKPGGMIQITIDAGKDDAEISVADNGVGMSPEYLRRLFDISVKHHTNGTNNERGTGLGLVLCKEFVEKNGGEIRVSSEEGRGSTFSFTLPRYVGSLVNA